MKPDPFITASGHANGESAVSRRRRSGAAACAKAVGAIAPRRSSTGFTLTEVLIALALISFMLVGISRIFTMTSSTISTGQGVSSALRTHRAVGQSLSTAFLGYSASGDIDKSDDSSGMLPLVIPEGSSRGAPFLLINNFRTPTFRSAEAARTAFSQPLAADTYVTESLKTRQVDLNGDGTITNSSTAVAGGEVIPLYYYGERNFRTDTISFFGQGNFRSQTGSAGTFVSDIRATECWYWYGHCRVFNSEIDRIHLSAAYGSPGDIETSGDRPNPNNRYANQFILGHLQGLLVEPQYAGGSSTGDKTVLTGGGEPVYFLGRRWVEPTDPQPGAPTPSTSERNDVLTPFYYNSGGFGGSYVQRYNPASGTNYAVNFQNEAATGSAAANDRTLTYHTRTDIIGSGVESLRQRVRHLESIRPRNDAVDWWVNIYTYWNERPWTNPFTGSLAADPTQALARRVPLLAEGCSQFIVEYAGDFVTQDPDTGERGVATPDGELDFAMVNGVKQVRWYGMPRDVNGDGVILGNTGAVPSPAIMQSPDVIYLRDIRGAISSFERPRDVNLGLGVPPAAASYQLVIAEPNTPNDFVRQNSTRYTCAWGASEFETPVVTLPDGRELYDVPQMIRIIVEVSDQKGRLGEPVTQEYVFPVKVKG